MHRVVSLTCPTRNLPHCQLHCGPAHRDAYLSSFASLCASGDHAAYDRPTCDKELEKLCYVGRWYPDNYANSPSSNVDDSDWPNNISNECSKSDCLIASYCFALNNCIKQKNVASCLHVYALLVNNGHELNSFVGSYLIRMFTVCGDLPKADQVFGKLQEPNVFAWSAVIFAHSKHGSSENAIQLYYLMVNANIQPDGHTYVAALQACANAAFLVHGHFVHTQIVENLYYLSIFLLNGVINMYLKCRCYDDAAGMFQASCTRDVVTWNVMMEGCIQCGCIHKTFQLFHQMQIEGIQPDDVTYVSILRASCCMESLQHGKVFHLLVSETGFEGDAFVGSTLIDMYCKCSSLGDACEAFKRSRHIGDAVTWRAMLSGYASHGHVLESFELFCRMQQEGLEIGKFTFASILHACSDVAALHYGKLIHTCIVHTQLEADKDLCHTLVSLYTKCEKLETACKVLDSLQDSDVVTWTMIMSCYADQGRCQKVFELFGKMSKKGIKADKVILNTMSKACIDSELGRLVHSYIQEESFEFDIRTISTLVEMYTRFELYEDVRWILTRPLIENFLTQVLSKDGNVEGLLLLKMWKEIQEGVISVLQTCSVLEDWEGLGLVHFYLIDNGFEWSGRVISCLISVYASSGMLNDACNLFKAFKSQDVIIWSAMIAGYANHGESIEALQMFYQMQQEGVQPDEPTFVSILKLFFDSSFLKQGKIMHARLDGCELGAQREITSSLIDMYANCGSLGYAQNLFDKLPVQDTLTWSALMAGYASDGNFYKACELFHAMQHLGPETNDTSPLVSILKACTSTTAQCFGKLIHHVVCERGCEFNLSLRNNLIQMYIKCGSLVDAERVFDLASCRSKVTWGLLISAQTESRDFKKALLSLQHMQQLGVTPDSVTIVSALKACSSAGMLAKGMLLHVLVIVGGLKANIYLANALISMYSNCGSLEDALKVFLCLPSRDTVTWNAIIAGCAHNSKWEMVWHYFNNMQNGGVMPDAITFMCVLSACSHMGLVEDGLHQFQCMVQQHGLVPTAEHYNCLIDLLGRTGYLLKAEDLLWSLPFIHNHVGWMSLLGHCNLHENADVGSRCVNSIC